MPLTATVREIASRHPARPAVVTPEGSLSYGELAAHTCPPGGVLAISLRSQLETVRLFVARCADAGITAVLDPHWPLAHRVDAILTAGVTQLVTDDESLTNALAARGWTPRDSSPTVGDEFLMLFSSGTTSAPKPILKTRAQYRANVAHSRRELATGDGIRTLAPGSLAYSLTLYALVEVLATGGTIVLTEDPTASACRTLIAQHDIQRLVTVPALLPGLCRGPLPSLDTIVVGGAHLPAAMRDAVATALPHTRLISYYGAAEIGFIGDAQPDGLVAPYPGVEVRVKDATADGIGTLWVRTASATPVAGGDGWVSVGDVGRIMDDGRIELLGRAGDVITTAGHTVALPAVEHAFTGCPGVTACCAIAEEDPVRGHRVALVVEGTAVRDALRDWAEEHLAPQYRPRRWYRVAALPRTVGGKIRRGETLALITRGEGEVL